LTIIDVNSDDIFKALDSEKVDFEDELIVVCAEKTDIDFIISRNTKDFKHSIIKTIEPEMFLRDHFF